MKFSRISCSEIKLKKLNKLIKALIGIGEKISKIGMLSFCQKKNIIRQCFVKECIDLVHNENLWTMWNVKAI